MATAAYGTDYTDKPPTRCAQMRLDQDAPGRIGYALKRIKLTDVDIGDDTVVVQPAMAGLRGPRLSLLGRDVRLAVTKRQVSPQELWHRGAWNEAPADAPCMGWPKRTWSKSIAQGWHWKAILDNSAGLSDGEPQALYRSRALAEGILVRPYGFTFGAALAMPLATNTRSLVVDDTRAPVRSDIGHFSTGIGLERAYASWRFSPVTDFHVGVTGGYLEEMYGGFGAEFVWRPFTSPFWLGADAWKVWRRDPSRAFNARLIDQDHFTGHLRAGYDMPGTRAGVSVAAGRFLGGDNGVSVTYTQDLFETLRIDAGLTWTDRDEDHGFFRNTHLEPTIRATWNPGGNTHYQSRLSFRQIGRDGGQALDRPLPLETLTEAFSAREMARAWPHMLD